MIAMKPRKNDGNKANNSSFYKQLMVFENQKKI